MWLLGCVWCCTLTSHDRFACDCCKTTHIREATRSQLQTHRLLLLNYSICSVLARAGGILSAAAAFASLHLCVIICTLEDHLCHI